MNAVLVSVVTISFRDPIGLRRTLQSVRDQDHPALEHIVIDGGSGAEVVSLLRDTPHLAFWRSQPDRGRYDAMNIGLGHASGDVIWFLHSGDTFADDRSASTALRGTGLQEPGWWAHGRARLVDADGSPHGLLGQKSFALQRFAVGGRPIPHQAALFHRELLQEVGLYSLTHGLAADQEFMLRAALVRPPIVLDEVLCDFDITGAGSTRGVHPHFADMRRATRELLPMPPLRRAAYLTRSWAAEARAYAAWAKRGVRRADSVPPAER